MGLRYDPETKHQSSQWKYYPRPKKAHQVLSKVKVMLIVFFDMEGIVHYEYIPQGQTVNQQFYLQVLNRLRLADSRKRPQKLAAWAWSLHHDNAPAHTAYSIQVFLEVMAFLSFSNHPTPLTWLRVTFGCSPN